MANSRLTIKSVAQAAGVSITTVSLVLNHLQTPNIPAETRQRVLNAVKELGYRPSASARQMRTHRSGMIGFITDVVASTPFAVDMIGGAQEIAWENHKVLMIINTGGDAELDEAAVNLLHERRVEGIVYAAMYHREVTPPQSIREAPTVLLNCFDAGRAFPAILPDEYGGASLAVEALIAKGHRRIGFINLFENIPAAIERREAYLHTLQQHNLPIDPDLFAAGGGEAEGGYQQTHRLLRLPDPPTAIFCTTDRMAMGAYDAIKESGLRIPQDVAVIGFDNQEIISAHLRPALTTVQLPHYEMGRRAISHLLANRDFTVSETSPIERVACPLIEGASI